MKTTLLTIGAIFALSASAQTDVKLNINHLFNDQPLEFETVLESSQPEELKISRLQYYISGIKLTHDGGQLITANDAFILVDAENTTDFTIGNYNITDLESIEFGIGVVASKNHEDPSTYPSDHALAPQLQSMHWGWSSGYRFIALEGTAGSGFSNTFQFHALGDNNFHTQTISTTGQSLGSEIVIELDADYYQAFNSISVADGPIEHGENFSGCLSLINNFKNSVFSERPAPPVGLTEEDNLFSLYPNPVSGVLNINISEIENKAKNQLSYQIVDVLGRQVLSNNLSSTQISIDGLNSGLYFLELTDGNTNLGRESFLIKD